MRYPVSMNEQESPPKPGVLVAGPRPEAARSRRPMTRRRRLLQALGAPVALGLMRSLWKSYRFKVEDDEEVMTLAAEGIPFILLFWHGEIFVGAWMLRRLASAGARITYIISPSKDGEFAVRLVNRVGGQVVRGSATRSGVKALRGLYRAITREKGSPVMLPDGPRGPRRQCKEGVLLLSQLAQAPIIPMGISARPAWHLKTWDRLLIPPPFAGINIRFAPSFVVPKDESIDLLRQRIPDLNRTLLDLEEPVRPEPQVGSRGGGPE